jgi:hypothetical protein
MVIKYVVYFIHFTSVELSYYQVSVSLSIILGSPMLKLHKTHLPKPCQSVPKIQINLTCLGCAALSCPNTV